MFKNERNVLMFGRGNLVFARVNTKPSIKVKKGKEAEWSDDTLSNILSDLKKEFSLKKIRILLSEDVVYVTTLKIKAGLKGSSVREAVASGIVEQFPEALDNEDWDFKTIKKNEDFTEVIAFAPVKDMYRQISASVNEAGLDVEAVEPEQVAGSRHKDPIVGIALKKDLSGKDDEVLNLEVLKIRRKVIADDNLKTKSGNDSKESDKKPDRKKSSRNIVVLILILIIACSVAFGAYYIYLNRAQEQVVNEQDTVEQVIVQEENEVVDLSLYNINILNGSGEVGIASEVEETLLAEGFSIIDKGNADSYDFEETIIQLKPGISDSVFETIDRALNSDFTITQSADLLTEDFEYDVVIIIGERQDL